MIVKAVQAAILKSPGARITPVRHYNGHTYRNIGGSTPYVQVAQTISYDMTLFHQLLGYDGTKRLVAC